MGRDGQRWMEQRGGVGIQRQTVAVTLSSGLQSARASGQRRMPPSLTATCCHCPTGAHHEWHRSVDVGKRAAREAGLCGGEGNGAKQARGGSARCGARMHASAGPSTGAAVVSGAASYTSGRCLRLTPDRLHRLAVDLRGHAAAGAAGRDGLHLRLVEQVKVAERAGFVGGGARGAGSQAGLRMRQAVRRPPSVPSTAAAAPPPRCLPPLHSHIKVGSVVQSGGLVAAGGPATGVMAGEGVGAC